METVTQEELDTCPFCEGREEQTPPETFAVAPPGREADTPGWSVRVVPNKYPAFEHHEVVIHAPRHARSFGQLSADQVVSVAEAWIARAQTARAAGFPHMQAVINEGREAGGSLAHSHSQLVWLPETPPLVRQEASAHCAVCRVFADASPIDEFNGVALSAPRAARGPYEMLVAPEEHAGDAFAGEAGLSAALELLRRAVGRLTAVEGGVPLNAWLHTAPFGGEGHWHIEVLPRFSIIASLELGAGIYINSLAPEEAAARLRGAPS
jgi:UDPglucose--hexose-1-phosphate uridylyltransferase